MTEIKFVITNPVPTMKIQEGDEVFVLSQTDPFANLYNDQKFYQEMGINMDQKKKGRKDSKKKEFGVQEVAEVEEEKNEFKAFDSAIGSKKEKNKFDAKMQELEGRLEKIKENVISLNKEFNKRNSSIVKNISKNIYVAMK